eukprot:Sspe_Gene.18190::Locus_6514_Transcript_3_3_Confidence_0.778_Length_682::g.18190::m.18190
MSRAWEVERGWGWGGVCVCVFYVVVYKACQAPECSPSGLSLRKIKSTGVEREDHPGVGAAKGQLLMDKPIGWLPRHLKPTDYHRLPMGMKVGEALEMQCCHETGCVFYVVVYK